jgi:hypothetical protein
MTPERKLLNKVITVACAKSADARFKSAEEFIKTLKGGKPPHPRRGKSLKKFFAILTATTGVPMAILAYLTQSHQKPSMTDAAKSKKNDISSPNSHSPSYLPKNRKERKELLKLLLRFQLHTTRKEYAKALRCLDEISSRWPEYPKESLNRLRVIVYKIEKKNKKTTTFRNNRK